MEIITGLRKIPNLSLALGFFDGVHLGHQAVIGCAVELAHSSRCKSAVLTFEKHPEHYLNDLQKKYIISTKDKYDLIEDLGVNYIIELDFESIFKLNPTQYLEDILVKYFSPIAISTGFNHHFGVGRSGGVNFLANCQCRYNYLYAATPPQTIFGEIISSSAIRRHIKSGTIPLVNSMLGRNFSISGTVIPGKKIGHTIGFPTANINYPEEIVELPNGVFAVRVILPDKSEHKGLANFGISPTISADGKKSLETYILNFDDDLYGKDIKIEFIKMIRPEFQFDSLDDLKTQIEIDIQSL